MESETISTKAEYLKYILYVMMVKPSFDLPRAFLSEKVLLSEGFKNAFICWRAQGIPHNLHRRRGARALVRQEYVNGENGSTLCTNMSTQSDEDSGC